MCCLHFAVNDHSLRLLTYFTNIASEVNRGGKKKKAAKGLLTL